MNEENQEMMTLVFMDLESTGLPTPGNNPRITELSMVAVDAISLKSSQGPPRVRNKLTLCMYPMRVVTHGAFVITGLYNDNLFYQKDFDESTADLINLFLQRLAPPVCLVAHNGLQYDFPLLLAEYQRIGKSLPDDLYCADSLLMFRMIDPDERIGQLIYEEQDEMNEDVKMDNAGGIQPPEEMDHLSTPPTTGKKGTLSQIKKSVKRKLFDDDDNNNIVADTKIEPAVSQEEILFDDEDDEDDRASVAASDVTEDYYGTLPGLEDVLDDLEQVENNTFESEWDSDADDIDDETLLSSTQDMINCSEQLQASQQSQESDLSRRSDCSSLLLTPPDSTRKQGSQTSEYDLFSQNADPQPSQSQVMPSTPTNIQELTPPKTKFKKFEMPVITPWQLSQVNVSPQNSQSSKFNKLIMPVTPAKQMNALESSQSDTTPKRGSASYTPQSCQVSSFKKYVMPTVTTTPSQVNSSPQSSHSSTFIKFTMPGVTQTKESSQSDRTPKQGNTPGTPQSSQSSKFQKFVRTPKTTTKFVKFVMPGVSTTPMKSNTPQSSQSPRQTCTKFVMPSQNDTPTSANSSRDTTPTNFPQNEMPTSANFSQNKTSVSANPSQSSKAAEKLTVENNVSQKAETEHASGEPIPGTSKDYYAPAANAKDSVVKKPNTCSVKADPPIGYISGANAESPTKRKSYILANVYYRAVGKYPATCHTAEDDSMALFKICSKWHDRVCPWINEHSELYRSVVQPMYENKFGSKGLPQGVFPFQQ